MTKKYKKKYNTLIVSGGGIKGFFMLGSLQSLFDKQLLETNQIKKYIGTSVGAIINALIIIGYEPKEILANIIQYDFFKALQFTPFHGLSGDGFLDFQNITILLEKMIKQKMDKIPTIDEFCTRYNISFVAVTFNYTLQKEFVISQKNAPELNLLDALRMTSNVPFLFQPFTYNDEEYLDGFLVNNYPIDKLDIIHDTPIGIYCDSPTNKNENKKTANGRWNMFWNVIHIPLNQLQQQKRGPYYDLLDNIKLDTSDLYEVEYYNMTPSKMLDLFSNGYSQTSVQLRQDNFL